MSGGREAEVYEKLAARIKAREESAFRDFARLFSPFMRTYFLDNGIPQPHADDLVADSVTDILLRVEGHYQERSDGSFRAWVMECVRNVAAGWHRKHRLKTDALSDDPPSPDTGGSEPAHLAETQAVRDALSSLNEIDRQILEMRELGGMWSYAEIARDLDISEAAARVRHMRLLQRLEAILENDPRIKRKERAAG